MKKLVLVIVLLSACHTKETDFSKQASQEIINADKAMNLLASKEGFYKALLHYADENVIKPNEGVLPIIGKTALQLTWAEKPVSKEITWEPLLAEASVSGDLGYTFGNWKYTTKDTVMYGNYYTIWKKQTDGAWKFVMDGGNNTPKP